MIKNSRQAGSTRAQLDKLQAALEELRGQPDDGWLDLEIAAIEGQVAELQQELDEYEGLRTGAIPVGSAATLDELPRLLIRQRIAKSMSQKDLADVLGMKEQQVQRYEADDWGTANLRRLAEVASALDLSVQGLPIVSDIPAAGSKVDPAIARALGAQGIEKDFLRRRLQPSHTSELADVVDLTARLSRIYGWTPSEIIGGELSNPEPQLAAAAAFKLPKGTKRSSTRAYTVYSQYLALLTLDVTSDLEQKPIPAKPAMMRELILDRHGVVNFESILETAWDLGIPVLPLADPGAFHAVLWRTAHRNVIVLKQTNRSPSRWAFDLLHELRHASEDPDADQLTVIEDEETDSTARSEIAANRFAGEVLLDGRAQELAEEAADRAKGSVQLLKSVVPQVAEDHDVSSSDFANYLAYHLSTQGIDWWGTAQNLQDLSTDPWVTARRRYLASCDLQRIAPLDRDLLLQALE